MLKNETIKFLSDIKEITEDYEQGLLSDEEMEEKTIKLSAKFLIGREEIARIEVEERIAAEIFAEKTDRDTEREYQESVL